MELKDLCLINGTSGNEKPVREYLKAHFTNTGYSCEIDRLGNLIAYKPYDAKNKYSVLVSAHMDEPGFIATHITEEGFVKVEPLGHIDPRVAVSKRVTIGKNNVPGVIGAKAIHLQSKADRERVLDFDDLYIDIGAKDKADAQASVSRGDYIHFLSDWMEFGDGFIKSKAMDNRVGCYILSKLAENNYDCDITFAFSVQNQIGSYGATTISKDKHYDLVIIVDAAEANDLGMTEATNINCKPGFGPVLSFTNPAVDRASVKLIKEFADKSNLVYQMKQPKSDELEAKIIQTAFGGHKICTINVPCRNKNTGAAVVKKSDIDNTYKLLYSYLKSI